MTGRNAVAGLADLRGVMLRTMQNPVHVAVFRSPGASPVPVVWGEVFTSLGQGVIGAQENLLSMVRLNSLWKVHMHVALTRHLHGLHPVQGPPRPGAGEPHPGREAAEARLRPRECPPCRARGLRSSAGDVALVGLLGAGGVLVTWATGRRLAYAPMNITW